MGRESCSQEQKRASSGASGSSGRTSEKVAYFQRQDANDFRLEKPEGEMSQNAALAEKTVARVLGNLGPCAKSVTAYVFRAQYDLGGLLDGLGDWATSHGHQDTTSRSWREDLFGSRFETVGFQIPLDKKRPPNQLPTRLTPGAISCASSRFVDRVANLFNDGAADGITPDAVVMRVWHGTNVHQTARALGDEIFHHFGCCGGRKRRMLYDGPLCEHSLKASCVIELIYRED